MPDQNTHVVTNVGDALNEATLATLPAGTTVTDRTGDTYEVTIPGTFLLHRHETTWEPWELIKFSPVRLTTLPNGASSAGQPDLFQQARIALRDRYGVEPSIDDVYAVVRVMQDRDLTPSAAIAVVNIDQVAANINAAASGTFQPTAPHDEQRARHLDVTGVLDADFALVVFVKDNDTAGLARLRAHAALDGLLDQHGISR